jgi:hypothetical protein
MKDMKQSLEASFNGRLSLGNGTLGKALRPFIIDSTASFSGITLK